jgi:hypothetical protein
LNVDDDGCCGLLTDEDAMLFDEIIGGGLTCVDACSSADLDVSIQRPVF